MRTAARLAVTRPVAVTVLLAALALLGLLSLGRLPVELLPDIGSPKVAVLLRSPGFTPEELEERWGAAVEARLMTVRHVRSVATVARAGTLLFSVTCAWDADMDDALMDVHRAVGTLASDPDVRDLRVRRFDPRASPILTLGLTPAPGQRDDLELLRRLARELVKRRLERAAGVAEVSVRGGRLREVRVTPERQRLLALGLSIGELRRRIAAANVDADAGTLDQGGRYAIVRGHQRFGGPEDVAGVVLGVRPSAGGERLPVRLDDVADVRWDVAEIDNLVRVDGVEGVGLAVYKESDANTLAVTGAVRAALGELARELGDVRVSVVQEQAEYISAALEEVTGAAWGGALLAVLVLLAFLRRLGPTLVVASAIPLSLLLALPLMDASGLSLNVMTLGGLALGIGMLVDSAIVVVESTVRQRAQGLTPAQAALAAAGEVGAALAASTLAMLAVFLPVAFAHGLAARLFRAQALTVSFALLAALVVAALATPLLGARFLGAAAPASAGTGYLASQVGRLVAWALARRRAVLGLAALVCVLGLTPLWRADATGDVPAGQRQLLVRLRLAEGTRVEATQSVVAALEELARTRLGSRLAGLYAEVGRVPEDDQLPVEEAREENTASLWVTLRPEATAAFTPLVAAFEAFVRTLPEAQAEYVFGDAQGLTEVVGQGEPVVVEVRGRQWPEIQRTAAALEARLRQLTPALHNVRNSVVGGQRELRLEPEPSISAALGLDPTSLADALRSQIAPDRVTSFQEGDELRDVVLRFPARPDTELRDLEIDAAGGRRLLLGELAELRPESVSRELRRHDQSRVALLTARVAAGHDLGAITQRVQALLADFPAPPGIELRWAGAERERRETLIELAWLALLAVVLVLMVLAGLFESLRHPFTVLLTVPMGLTGAVLALWLWGQPLGVMAGIGLVILAGIVVNNAIVLVDYVGTLRAAGWERRAALVEAARVRLRPILMTSLTTMLGLLPQLLRLGPGAELRAPLALVVVGGLLSATLTTLFVIPVAYDLIDDLPPRAEPRATRA